MHAWLLAPDNFTPPTRTPWGGTAIASRYKRGLGVDQSLRVGESWELSAGPEFPSRVVGGGSLGELWASDPGYVLGDEAGGGATSLLVKMLDAADNLSVQIHPSDDYAGLKPDECGKPESWYVIDAAPGAGLYIGLTEAATPGAMRDALIKGGDVAGLLSFVPVEPGDFFLVDAGTAHAVGRGVALVEPQIVRPGRKGVTYRYWDWDRRYDAAGNPSPDGAPRALQVEHALAVTAWGGPRGEAFLRQICVRSGPPDLTGPLRLTRLCGRAGAPLVSGHLDVTRLDGRGRLSLPAAGRLRAVTVVEGAVTIEGEGGRVEVPRGSTAAVAARAAVELSSAGVHAIVSFAA